MAAAFSLSPIHIGLLFLLLARCQPVRRGGLFVLGWMVTIALMVGLLLTVGHGFLLSMEQGTSHRTGLDLPRVPVPCWPSGCANCCRASRVSRSRRPGPNSSIRLSSLPFAAADRRQCGPRSDQPRRCLFWWPSAAAALLAAGLAWRQEWILAALFTVAASLLLLLGPYLAVVLNRQGILRCWSGQGPAAGTPAIWCGRPQPGAGRLPGLARDRGPAAELRLSSAEAEFDRALSHRLFPPPPNQRRQWSASASLPLEPTNPGPPLRARLTAT